MFFFEIIIIALLQLTTGKHIELCTHGFFLDKAIRSNKRKTKVIYMRKRHDGNPKQFGQYKLNTRKNAK